MKPPAAWNSNTYKNRLFYMNNHGQAFGHTKNQLKVYSEGTSLEMNMYEENKMRISMRKGVAEYELPKENLFYFFFSLQGNSELEVQFTKGK